MQSDELDIEFDEITAGMSEGQRALEAIVFYRAHELPVPEWALADIEDCYLNFRDGAPSAGWTRSQKSGEAPRTLNGAFGIDEGQLKGAKLHPRRLRALYGSRIMGYFGPNGTLPRTEESFERVSCELGISPAEVQGIVRYFVAK